MMQMNVFFILIWFCTYFRFTYSLISFDTVRNDIYSITSNIGLNIPSYERQALHDFYTSTNGNHWEYRQGEDRHWNFTDPKVNPCLSGYIWQGLNCTNTANYYYISQIKLSNYNLVGYLPLSIGNFTKLQYLVLSENKLNHEIPTSIGNLSELIVLDLSYNSLTGALPNSLYDLSALKKLQFEYNMNLEGTISNLIGNLTNLQYLNLRANKISGTIPDSLGYLSQLIYLRFTSNFLTGTIPTSIRNLKSLQLLTIAINEMSGTLPAWLDELQSLQFIGFLDNHFTGIIPSTISYLSLLHVATFGDNQFTGTVPDWIGNMSLLQTIWLHNNQLTSTIPINIANLENLQEITLGNNLCVGDIYNIIGNQNKLQKFEVNDNYLTGTLPQSLSQLLSLDACLLQNNHFSGNLNNVINGSYQKQLNNIQLSSNQFTGTLINEIFSSGSLLAFSAVKNCFHGSIPSIICENTALKTLALDGLVCGSSCRNKILPGISSAYFSENEMTGGIPECLWSMPKLQVLHLSGNSLTGSLPDDITTSLLDLSLSYNSITGTIPSYIQQRQWDNLDLSYNHITGNLKSNFANQNSNASLSLNNNRLSGDIPNNLLNLKNISLLKGNFFDCKYDRSDLPTHDDRRDMYECGSNAFNVLYYIWLGMLAIIVISSIVSWIYWDQLQAYDQIFPAMKQKIRKWMNIIHHVHTSTIELSEDQTNRRPMSMAYFSQYLTIHNIVLRLSTYCTMFIIFFLVPIYGILSMFYTTHTYEYAWTVSISYLSGKVAFGIILSALFILIIALLYMFQYSVLKSNYHYQLDNICMEEDIEEEKRALNIRNSGKVYSMYLLYISINLIVVGGMNSLYLYVALHQSQIVIIITQIFVSIFKVCWSKFVSPVMLRKIVDYLSDSNSMSRIIQRRLFMLQFGVAMLNAIILPCVIVAIISPNCFYTVFEQTTEVKSSFVYEGCNAINLAGQCYSPIQIMSTTSYTPPFTYSYQCSTDFVSYYAFIYLLICIISTFLIPCLQISLLQLSTKYHWRLTFFRFHDIVYDLNDSTNIEEKATTTTTTLFYIDEIYEILIYLLTMVGLLLTFGVVFPPLAIAFLIAIYRRIYYHKAILGRYISHAMEHKAFTYLDIINNDCKVIPLLSTLQLCGWILLYISCGFYTLFVFDILGDEVGFNQAYWVLIVMPCFPIVVYMSYRLLLYALYLHTSNNNNNNVSTPACTAAIENFPRQYECTEVVGVELSSMKRMDMISNPLLSTTTSHQKQSPIDIIDGNQNNTIVVIDDDNDIDMNTDIDNKIEDYISDNIII